jgi:cysteine desulfurase family protein (TIGR01976 family)
MSFHANAVRAQFPALNQPVDNGVLPVFFDNPAGTQVPQRVIDAVRDYFTHMNANSGGTFATSQRNDAMVHETRVRLADFLNAPNPHEIVIGANMTTLNFALSRALAQGLSAGDEIVLTRMDHDGNVAPWLRIAQDKGLTVKWVDIRTDDCTLDMDSLEEALSGRTKIVATVHASNAVGTVNPVKRIADMVHATGALHIVDAVQSAPHVPIDVQEIGCDFLLCSSYKFFGPHQGILWGRYNLLAELPAYKVRPSKDKPPYRWETGTPAFELISAIGATLDYLTEIGREYGQDFKSQFPNLGGRQLELKAAMAALSAYERELVTHLLEMLQRIPKVHIAGITDATRYSERVPTVVFTMDGYTAEQIAKHLAQNHIYVWDGNYYAVEIMARLGHSEHGMVRVGLAHYNTHEEIDRLESALLKLK